MQQTSMQKEIINNDKIKGGFNMFKTLKKRIKNEKGLTLIELLAVIVILAIVAAIAVPAIGNIIAKSEDRAILADASSILAGAKLAYTNGDCDGSALNSTTGKPCNGTNLAGYVEGITLSGDEGAVKNGNVWTVTYSKISEIDKITVTTVSGNVDGVTEANLNAALKE